MSRERHARLADIFARALAVSEDERSTLLDEACRGDDELRRHVERLLAAEQASENSLDLPAVGDRLRGAVANALAGAPSDAPIAVPDRIGSYRIHGLLGAGASGTLFDAEQEAPSRRVALKLLKPGICSRAAIARFEREVELLGRLNHPGIVRVYEAGWARVDGAGSEPQPYFAMELVDGDRLDVHADQEGLGHRQRLALLAQVCDAVHHAHSAGVLHRDLKPANILVDRVSGQPKVLDFGVARALDLEGSSTAERTRTGTIIGTLPYLSPEQAAGKPGEVDATSDVYALGVIGYELLARRHPQDLADLPLSEALRVIREETVAPLGSLDTQLRGDVETVVGKALEKERSRRYASAAELAADVRRHLAAEPVTARPPSAGYRIGKFARRNRVLVASVSAVILALVAGLVGTGRALKRALRAEGLATERLEATTLEAAKSEAILDFVTERILGQASPEETLGEELSVAEAVERAAEELDGAFIGQPEVKASVHATVGEVLLAAGKWEQAEEHLKEAVDIRTRVLGAHHRETLETQLALVQAHVFGGSPDEAGRIAREVVAATERPELAGETEIWLRARREVAMAAWAGRQEREGALGMLHELLPDVRDHHGEGSAEHVALLQDVATVLYSLGRYEEAFAHGEDIIEATELLHGERHPETLLRRFNQGTVLRKLGRLAEAERTFDDVLELRREVLGPEHPDVARTLMQLGAVRVESKRFAAAFEDFAQAAEAFRDPDSGSAVFLPRALSNAGYALIADARPAEAEPYLREAIALYEQQGRPDVTSISVRNLGRSLRRQGRLAEACETFRQAIELAAGSPRPQMADAFRVELEGCGTGADAR